MSHNSSHCFFPPYCWEVSTNHCSSTPLSMCPQCSMSGAIGILLSIVFLAVLIIICNCIVIIPIFLMDASSRTRSDHIKASLAIADMLPGVTLLALSSPKLVRSTYETPEQIIKDELESLGTAEAFFAGIFFLFLYSSTIYHLFYMGIQRYVAINWPMRYRSQSIKSIRVQLSFIWLFSLVSGTLSGWFQDSFHFVYSAHTFQYLPDIEAGGSIYASIVLLVIFFVLPYISMTLLTSITLVKLHKMKKLNQAMWNHSSVQSSSRRNSRDFRSLDPSVDRSIANSLDTLSINEERRKVTQIMKKPRLKQTFSASGEQLDSRDKSVSENCKNLSLPRRVNNSHQTLTVNDGGLKISLSPPCGGRRFSLDLMKNADESNKNRKDSLISLRRGSFDILVARQHRNSAYDVSLASEDGPSLMRFFRRLSSANRSDSQRRQHHCFVTIGMMQAGFSITVVPLLVSLSLFSFHVEGCDDGPFHFIMYYISLFSSLVNVFIYSFRDERFRHNVAAIAKNCRARNCWKKKGPQMQKPTTTIKIQSHTGGLNAEGMC